MAEEKPKDERTEAPTARRKEQAREKGERLSSKELATAFAGMAGGLWLWAAAPGFAAALQDALATALTFDHQRVQDFRPIDGLAQMLWPLMGAMLALAGLVLVAAIMGQGGTGGIGFTPNNLMPKMGRMNPISGIKRIFGSKGLIELGKALLKVTVLGVICWWVLSGLTKALLGLSALPTEAAIISVADMGLELVLALVFGLALIGAVDLPIQIYQWLQRLKMTKQDVKDEVKQQEGSPEVKYAIRRMARESLKRSNRSAMVDATVVVTNPTHFAVALRYDPERDAAPVIVARGRGIVAEAIRELANEQNIPILSYPSVARAIYFTGKVGAPIRGDLYTAVATILAFVLRVSGPDAEQPEAEAPETALFDEHGRKVKPSKG